MPIPIPLNNEDVEALAADFGTKFSTMVANLQSWKASVEATSKVNSAHFHAYYQEMAAILVFVDAKGGTPGLVDAYKRRFASLPTNYDLLADWATARAAIVSLGTWLRNAWPEKTATGKPAYHQYTASGEHGSFDVPLDAGGKTAMTTRLQAVIDAFARAA